MIKIFEANTAGDLERKVNEFMKQVGYNCAVRDHVAVVKGRLVFTGTVFWDGEKEEEKPPVNQTASAPAPPTDTGQQTDRGALWIQKNGTITGNWKGKKVTLTQEEADFLKENTNMEAQFGEDYVYILTSKYKTSPKHPDYIILPRKVPDAKFKQASLEDTSDIPGAGANKKDT